MLAFRSWHALGFGLTFLSAHAATYEVTQQNPRASDDGPGSAERPWQTISKAAQVAAPGDIVIIHGGVYRERVVVKTSGMAMSPIRLEAAAGEHVLITGADRLTGWRKADNAKPIYGIAWPHRFVTWNRSMAHPDDEYHRLIGRCEQVIVDGYFSRHV